MCSKPPKNLVLIKNFFQNNKKAMRKRGEKSTKPKIAAKNEDEQKIVFEAIPVTQVVCNFARTVTVAKDQACTEIGKKLASNFVRVAATRIFADPYQSIMELVSNAIDASVPAQNKTIGRFGMGFFSIFALLLSTKDFEKVTVITTQGKTFQIDIVVQNEELTATLTNTQTADQTGTSIKLEASRPLEQTAISAIKRMVEKFKFLTSVNITMNGKAVGNSNPRNKTIEISVEENFFLIVDHGTGMSLDNLRGLLTPSVSTKGLQSREAVDVKEEPPSCLVLDAPSHSLLICVNGVLIKRVDFDEGDELENGTLSVMLLPASTKLPVARNDVILSHPETFEHVKAALDELYEKHVARKNVSMLRTLIRKYSRECFQIEAYRLVQWLDNRILASKAVLIPDDNPMVATVCKELGLDFVVSDLFNFTKLQAQILKAVKKEMLDKVTFHSRTAIVLKTLKDPVETIPCLSRLAFVRKDAKKQDLENYAQDASNSCMTSEQFKVWEKHGLTVTPIQPFVDEMEFEMLTRDKIQNIKEREKAILENSTLVAANTLWQRKFAVLSKETLESHMVDFVKIWTLVTMDMNQFEEVVSTLVAKLASAKITPDSHGTGYNAVLNTCRRFGPRKRLPALHRDKIEELDWYFAREPIPTLELEWIKFKIELFPDEVKENQVFAQFYTPDVWENCGFADLASSWMMHVSMQYVCEVFQLCHEDSRHILETFVIALFVKLYFDAFDLDQNVEYVVGHIRQELRKNVSLEQLISLISTTMLSGQAASSDLIVATVVNPIYITFPIIASSQQAPVLLRLKDPVKARKILCKFTVNDLMMFAYTDESLKSASQLMSPQVLKALANFAKTNGGECDIQAVLIAANFGTTKSVIASILTELFQNSSDAMLGRAVDIEDKQVNINVDRKELRFEDPVGIPFAKIMTLLLPFYSEKRMDANASGEMGTGFFNLFRLGVLEQVTITTKFEGEDGVLIVATPLMNDDGFVKNVAVVFQTLPGDTARGTQICGRFNKKHDSVSLLAEVYLTSLQNFNFAPFPVFLNSKQINADPGEKVYRVENVLSVRGFATSTQSVPSIITINNVPFGLLRDHWDTLIDPEADNIGTGNSSKPDQFQMLQLATQTNVCFEISRDELQPVQSRDKLVIKNFRKLRMHVLQAQVRWLLMLYGNGQLDSLIPFTRSKSELDQIKFVDPPYINGQTLSTTWAPRKFSEFISVLHWIMVKVELKGKGNPGLVANEIIDGLAIKDVFKKALKRWFFAKILTKEEQRKAKAEKLLHKAYTLDDIVENRLYTVEPVLVAFVQACVNTFNESGITLTEFAPGDPKKVMHTATKTDVPLIIGCVNDDVNLEADGIYVLGRKCLLLSQRHREMVATLLAQMKTVPAHELATAFGGLVQDYFFQVPDRTECTMLHELVHHICNDEHSAVAHPELEIVAKNQKPFQHGFQAVVVELQKRLLVKGLCSKFLKILQMTK